MEDKLYFKPETSGNKKRGQKKKDHKFLKLFLFLLFLLIIVLIIIWLLKGSKTVSGRYPENVRNESLVCKTEKLNYEKLTQVTSDKKELEVNMIFEGEEKIKSLSLLYTMYFNSEKEVRDAENISNAELGKALAAAGFYTTDFDNKFSKYDDRMTVSLYSTGSRINEFSAPFFMLKTENGVPTSLKEFKTNYESSGFSCTSTAE